MNDKAVPPKANSDAAGSDRAVELRKQMVDTLIVEGTILSAQVEAAMRKVPRELFAPGVELVFMHRRLSRYVHAMGQAGLLIEDMEEPPPPSRLLADAWPFPEAATIPRLLLLRARRSA